MKKKLFTAALLVLMAASMMLFATGCNAEDSTADDAWIAQLQQENADLQQQVEELTAELERMKQKAALETWNLSAAAWSDGNGATVDFSAVPVNYVEGMKAALSVRMGELEAESTNCNWDGTAFVGSVELSAADGYSYYCVLTGLDGTQSEIELNSPNSVTNETLVYLGSSLSAYANLMVEDWEATDTALVIKSGYVQVQMPRLTFNNMTAGVSSAALVLKLNNEETERQVLVLEESDGEGSYEATLTSQSFAKPAGEDDYQLDLWIEVTLNTGNTVSVSGGSWFSNNGELQLVVG